MGGKRCDSCNLRPISVCRNNWKTLHLGGFPYGPLPAAEALLFRVVMPMSESGAMTQLHFGENEPLVRHLHATVETWLNDGGPGASETPFRRG
jgi:hypothetical protein